MKIQTRLQLTIIPILVLIFFITFFIDRSLTNDAFEDQIQEKSKLLSRSYSSQLESKIKQYHDLTVDLASSVVTAINIETSLQALQLRYPEIHRIYYTAESGEVLYMAPYEKKYESIHLESFNEWENAFYNRVSSISRAGQYFEHDSVLIFAPVLYGYVPGKSPSTEGVVVLEIPLSSLFKDIQDSHQDAVDTIIISDNKGRLLFNESDIDAEYITDLSSDFQKTNLIDAIKNKQSGFLTYQNRQKYLTFYPLQSNGWSLMISGNYNEIMKDVSSIGLLNLFILIIAAGLGAIILFVVIRSIVIPIEKLTKTMQAITAGDKVIVSKIQTSSEVGILSEAMNTMVCELREYHNHLEETVNQRTYELNCSNEELAQTNEELAQTNEELAQTNEELNTTNEHLEISRRDLESLVREQTQQVRELAFLVESAASPIAMADLQGNMTYVNPAFIKTWNYINTEEIIGRSISDFCFINDPLDKLISRLEFDGPVQEEIKAQSAGGEIFDIRFSASIVKDNENVPIAIMFSAPDISEKKRAEWELHKAQSYIDNTINLMPSTLIGITTDGIVTQWNKKAEYDTGIPAFEAIGKELRLVYPRLETDLKLVANTLKTRELYTKNARKYVYGEKTGYENIIIFPLTSAGFDGAVIRLDDVTEIVELENSVRRSQKFDALGQLAGGIAHDFNNMLAGILGGAELLQYKLAEDENHMKYIDMIIESASSAANLTGRLLTLTRQHVEQNRILDIHDAINDAVNLLKSSIDKRIQLECNYDAAMTQVYGDMTQLQNIFLNMGINAGHAMENGGTLSITTDTIYLEDAYCENSSFTLTPGAYVDIEIKDTGTGISPEYMDKIFDPFFTTKDQGKGTGLGLASVYAGIKQHKGAILVSSTPGEGTTFNIYLPLNLDEQSKQSTQKNAVTGAGTILLIDDENTIRFTVSEILSNLGYTVKTAACGNTGLEEFMKHQDEIDLVILDMIMPDLSGKDCYLELKKINPDIPIVIASGYANSSDIDTLREMGIEGFLKKPYTQKSLSQLMASVLNT